MTANAVIQLTLYFFVLLALVKPLGAYMARVYQGEPCGLDRARLARTAGVPHFGHRPI